jgi:hypothetical protein
MTDAAGGNSDGAHNALVLDRLDRRNRNLKNAIKTITTERDSARTERDALKTELAEVRTQNDSSALLKRNQELEARLRVIDHRKVLDAKALAKGIKPEAIDAFYELSRYEAKGEPNPDEIGAFVDSKVEAFPYLVGSKEPPQAGEPPAPEEAARKPGVGSGKSKPGAAVMNGFELPPKGDARWNDPKWYIRNQAKLAEIAREAESRGVVLDF